MTAAVEGKLGEPSSSNETITGTPGAAPSVTTGALLASFNKLKDYSANLYSQRRPWGEVFDRTAFSRPTNFSEATSRVRRNATYFKINYAAFMVIALLVVMLMNPSSLAVLALLGTGWLYVFVFRTRPITIGDRTLSEHEKFMAMTGVSVFVVFFLTSVASTLFSAVGLGVAAIVAHGSMRVPDDLFLDEAEGTNSNLMNMFTQTSVGQVTVAV